MVFLASDGSAAAEPGDGKDLDGAGKGFDAVGGGAGGDGYVANSKGVKDVQRSCPARRVGHVMVAGEEEDGDAGEGETADAAGEFSLVGLGRVTGTVCIAGEDDQVCARFFQRKGDQFIEGAEGIDEAGRHSSVGCGAVEAGGERLRQGVEFVGGNGAAVGLNADVGVGEVDDTHRFQLKGR